MDEVEEKATIGISVYLVFWGLVCAMLSALNPILSKPVLDEGYHYATMLLLGSCFFGMGSLIFALMCKQHVWTDFVRMSYRTVASIAIVNLLCGFVGNMIFYHLLSEHHSHLVTAITATTPLFSFLIAYVFLSEPVTIASMGGIGMVVAGTIIAMQ